jgi:predicted nucleic acid-binding protein
MRKCPASVSLATDPWPKVLTMPISSPPLVLMDTSYLRAMGFNHPDLRKLLEHSKAGNLRLYVPHIAWEERRTQEVDEALQRAAELRTAFTNFERATDKFRLSGLPVRALQIPNDSEFHALSTAHYKAFADEHRIEILPIHESHAERAWSRYFDVLPPFDRGEKRENRRKDIPDAWIYEAAIDVFGTHQALIVLCDDKKLGTALKALKIAVYTDAAAVISAVEGPQATQAASLTPSSATAPISTTEGAAAPSSGPLALISQEQGTDRPRQPLDEALVRVSAEFAKIESLVIGFVGYLKTPTKDQLFELLKKLEIDDTVAKNAAERMATAKIIVDTGSHYIPGDINLCELAARSVESDIIKAFGL